MRTRATVQVKNNYIQDNVLEQDSSEAFLLQFTGSVRKYSFVFQILNLDPGNDTSNVYVTNESKRAAYTVTLDGNISYKVQTIETFVKFIEELGADYIEDQFDLIMFGRRHDSQNTPGNDESYFESYTITGSVSNATLDMVNVNEAMLSFDFLVGKLDPEQ